MADIVTKADVYNFMDTPTVDRTSKIDTMIDAIIPRNQDQMENFIGRKITSQDFTGILFQNDLRCKISKDRLYFSGKYRDTYSISSLTEAGTVLTASTAFDDDNDYYYDWEKGILIRFGQNWSTSDLAILITGKLGLGNITGTEAIPAFAAKPDFKQILIKLTAIDTGKWKQSILTPEGDMDTERNELPESVKDALEKYRLVSV